MTDNDASANAALWRRVSGRPDHLVLQRMRVHGFWPVGQGLPEDPLEEREARARLEAQRAQLLETALTIQDPVGALRAENARRLEASRARRAAAKQLREEARAASRAAWDVRRAGDVVHVGLDVSARLEVRTSDVARLAARGLPVIHDAVGLAALLEVPLPTLRWLTFHRRGAALVHYHRYDVPKKSGGARGISAPKDKLKAAQGKVLTSLLAHLPVDAHAHGFVSARSIVTNALPHVKRKIVLNFDLADFFPSITFRRVRGLFRHLGYGGQVSTLLGLLCTEPPRVAVELDGKIWHVALAERQLPQGASTSPAVTNQLCARLDRRLAGLAEALGAHYTRYADDLTFSLDDAAAVKPLVARVRDVVVGEGFTLNDGKTRVMRRGRRQEVTGVVVNHHPTVARDEVRRLRALLFNCGRHGLESQNRDAHPAFASHLTGRVAFVRMVDPQRGAALAPLLARAIAAAP